MVSHGRVELLAHPLSQKYLQMKWNSYGKYFHLANVLFYSIFLFFVTCFSYEIMRHEEQPNMNSTVNLTHDVSTTSSFGTKNCGFFAGVRQPQQVQHFECQDNPSDVHECCGHHQLHNHQHHTGDDPDVPTKVYVFHGPHQSGHVDTLLGCDCHGPAHLLGYHVRTPVFLRVSYRVPQLVQSSPPSATLRPSRDLRGDVPRDITDTHQSTHGLLNPDHRVRTGLLHPTVKGEYSASLIVQYRVVFQGDHLSFKTIPMSLVRTFSMMLGEIDFLGTYVKPYYLTTEEERMFLPFPIPAFFILGLFMVLMPILLMNLLIGLAVGDIESVRRNAQLKRLAMQVVPEDSSVLPTGTSRVLIFAGGAAHRARTKTTEDAFGARRQGRTDRVPERYQVQTGLLRLHLTQMVR
jgi:hypothetical protein